MLSKHHSLPGTSVQRRHGHPVRVMRNDSRISPPVSRINYHVLYGMELVQTHSGKVIGTSSAILRLRLQEPHKAFRHMNPCHGKGRHGQMRRIDAGKVASAPLGVVFLLELKE
jgi:hypothetical protein